MSSTPSSWPARAWLGSAVSTRPPRSSTRSRCFRRPGQGALAVECRSDRTDVVAAVSSLDDPDTRACVVAERSLLATLEAGLHRACRGARRGRRGRRRPRAVAACLRRHARTAPSSCAARSSGVRRAGGPRLASRPDPAGGRRRRPPGRHPLDLPQTTPHTNRSKFRDSFPPAVRADGLDPHGRDDAGACRLRRLRPRRPRPDDAARSRPARRRRRRGPRPHPRERRRARARPRRRRDHRRRARRAGPGAHPRRARQARRQGREVRGPRRPRRAPHGRRPSDVQRPRRGGARLPQGRHHLRRRAGGLGPHRRADVCRRAR